MVERRMVTRQGNPRNRPSFGPLVHGSTVHWDAPKEILRLADLRHDKQTACFVVGEVPKTCPPTPFG